VKVSRSQGKGIFLFEKLSEIAEWKHDTRWQPPVPGKEDAQPVMYQITYVHNDLQNWRKNMGS